MAATPENRTLKAITELEDLLDHIDPKTFGRDSSLKQLADGLVDTNDQLENISTSLKTLVVILTTPEKMRTDIEVIHRNYIHLQKSGLI